MEQEKNRRFVIQAQFPGPMYRDSTVQKVYKSTTSADIEELKQARIDQMLRYDYDTTEWYSIKSILSFCFASIGNFYTRDEKIKILELIYELFNNNYNKKLFLFDSFSRKVYGMETTYISINVKQKILFFKSPIESVFIEIRNKSLVERMHKYYSSPIEAPSHVNFLESVKIIKILQDALKYNNDIKQAYEMINRETNYGELFYNNLSIDLQKEVSIPKAGQRRNQKENELKIVILDRLTLGLDIDVSIFEKFGEVVSYDITKEEETLTRVKDADIVITNKVVINKIHMDN